MNNLVVTPMTKEEARQAVDEINSGISTIADKVYEFKIREGWRALEYLSWRECAMAEFGYRQRRVYQLFDFAEVKQDICTNGANYPPPRSERQTRPLVPLSPEQRVEAWSIAVETSPNGKLPTGEHVQSVVDKHFSPTRPEFDYDSHLDDDSDEEELELRYQGGPAYCKYCYTLHEGWEMEFGNYPITWRCLNCGHFVADEVMALEDDYNYKRDNRRATPSDVSAPQGNDACQTPPYAIDPLLPYLSADWLIWEPAAGEGFLVEALYDASRQVVSSDILDGRNFFEYEPDAWDCITTNPPFSITQQWLRRCYELGKPFALLIKVEALGTKGVQELIQQYGFEIMLLDKRVDFKMPFLGWGDEERKSSAQFPVFWLCWQLLPEKVMFGKIDKRGFNGQPD